MATASLPSDFLWGFATAAYQIEGATTTDSRGPSIWDTFCALPGKIADSSSGVRACDSYNRTAEDIALLVATGAKAYRFSISWSRIVPLGGRDDPVNQAGIDHYVKFVDDLLAAGVVPLVTLFHWDLPEELHRRYGGFLDRREFVRDFVRYARVVFEALAGKVKYWITFNEPWVVAVMGYAEGVFAPGRTSDRTKSDVGDSSTEPWIVGHSILVAHGEAVKLYRESFKERHGGQIGITLNGDWAEPWDSDDELDHLASQHRVEFNVAWFADPIYLGHYPASMRAQLGDRLPRFSPSERALVLGSNDFYGMNHYTTAFARHSTATLAPLDDFVGNLTLSPENKRGVPIGPETQSVWLRPHAPGFRKLLKWITDRYGRPVIYVTENGTSVKGENDLSREEILRDDFRVKYYEDYIEAVAQAVAQDGVDCRGYMAWSLLDNFEWADGYETRFGSTYVDYDDDQKRYLKKSALEMKTIFDRYIGKA